MATKITTNIAGDVEAGKSQVFYVAETFDECMDKIYPTSSPGSAIEARGNMVFRHYLDSEKRLTIHGQYIAFIEENCEPET